MIISLEGIDGSGKSYCSELIADTLNAYGKKSFSIGAPSFLDHMSARVISGFRSCREYDPLLIIEAHKKDLEALNSAYISFCKSNDIVIIVDRYVLSISVYISTLLGLGFGFIDYSNAIYMPDLVIWLDSEPKVAFDRIKNRGKLDWWENLAFLERLSQNFQLQFDNLSGDKACIKNNSNKAALESEVAKVLTHLIQLL